MQHQCGRAQVQHLGVHYSGAAIARHTHRPSSLPKSKHFAAHCNCGWLGCCLQKFLVFNQKFPKLPSGKLLWYRCAVGVQALLIPICVSHYHIIVTLNDDHGTSAQFNPVEAKLYSCDVPVVLGDGTVELIRFKVHFL